MLDFIRGKLDSKTTKSITIDNNNIGYRLFVSTRTLNKCGSTGDEIKVFVRMLVKEDSLTLYGFMTNQEREMFNKVTSVSGIGPRIALAILSSMTTTQLAISLVTEDVKSITMIKGIGPKTAKRMILELKEKIDNDELSSVVISNSPVDLGISQEAIQALMALGFSSIEASKAVGRVKEPLDNVQELITAALRTRGA